jgi:hypothetical protein
MPFAWLAKAQNLFIGLRSMNYNLTMYVIAGNMQEKNLERAMGFEPTTTCLGSKDSTPELRPHCNLV